MESKTFTGYYPVVDCEHQGDIDHAIIEVKEAGGTYLDVIEDPKDTDGEIDDYYESRDWYIEFTCSTEEEYHEVCEKLGM